MTIGMIGEKVGMTQYFTENGKAVGATVIEVDNSVVVQVKTEEKDGYNAVQLGYKDVEKRKLTDPMKGHFEKHGVSPKKFLSEFRVEEPENYEPGEKISVGELEEGIKIDVSGNSKGKGFQGVMKRWDFSGGPKTHGSRFHRRPGSVGMCVEPGRVIKGQKLPGKMGNERVTIQNLKTLRVDEENELLVVKGSVPGPEENILELRSRDG